MKNTSENINDHDEVYVVPNLAVETLVEGWYAWSHLISPATAALNIKNRHLKIIDSYIQNPRIHAAAVKTPKMLGGPFIDYDGKRVDEIQELRDNTIKNCAVHLELCDAIAELNEMLANEATGYSLEPLYEKVPESLRGMVELIYDLNNNPSFRFFEPLLYASKFYDESIQSVNLFCIEDDDSRSFVLSTPRLPDPKVLNFKIPLRSTVIDELFKAERTSRAYGELKQLFNITDEQEPLFQTFFTKEAPKQYEPYEGNGVLTRYFGHASILAETKNTSVLVDPVISYGYDSDISRYTYADLPEEIDYVLITHNHQDHILFETLLRIRHKIKKIIVPKSNGGGLQDPNIKLMLEKIGFNNIIEIGELETLHFQDCTITGIPFLGEHSDLDVRSKLCHMVNFVDNYKMLFVADSCNIEPRLYSRIQELYGNVDVLFAGMECEGAPLSWLYGPLLPNTIDRSKDQTRRLSGSDYDECKSLIDIFSPKHVFIYAMGMEPWLKYISSIKYTDESFPIIESNRILEHCKNIGVDAERLYGEKTLEYKVGGKLEVVSAE
ncbi:MBL fold metallo-hydrolase [Kordia jejudonensis]|uniref:MBL fold metallo-hydrolase n=1 Tax=Kordia jejudonensis TaxID=1348245 RepID=UPI0006299203|nr:MBL fold metallo-hydrolase [Kordia jejudonensis]